MDFPPCLQRSCIHWKNEHSSLRSPERSEAACLEFEDAVDFLGLKAEAIKITLT